MLPELHHQSVIGFGCFLFLRQKALHQHRLGVCTSLFPAGCLGRTRVSLQQGRKEAEEGLDESEVEGATGPVVGADGDAGAEVVHVHPAETFREGTMVHEGVDLKVVLEAAEVEVGRPDASQLIVRE